MLKPSEAEFWRAVARSLGVLLGICVLANVVRGDAVPHEITLLLFGSLVALGVGNAVVNPRTSAAVLTEREEARFRRRQYVIGFVFSGILALLLTLKELRESPLAWLFAPIMLLPFVLVIRERVIRG